MDKIDYNAIKRTLERMPCRVHGEHPTVTIVRDGVNIKCCCDQFQKELTKKTEDLATKQVSDAIDAAFRKAFK